VKSYLITDPAYYGSDPASLTQALQQVFVRHHPDFALFRDKQTLIYQQLAATFIEQCRSYKIPKVLLHGNPLLAHRFGADGVHLTSQQHQLIREAKRLGLYVIVSTHSLLEALMVQDEGADAITYSPIFYSPNKGEPKGLEDLKELVAKIDIPVFALGGITTAGQIKAVEKCGAYGFASIRYFYENTIR